MGNSASAWGEGGNTQRENTVRFSKIRSSLQKMNSHGCFPAQEHRGNAELNYQVRVSKQKKFPVLTTIKIPLRFMVLSSASARGRVFIVCSSTIAQAFGSSVALRPVPQGNPGSHSTEHNAGVLPWHRDSSWKVLQFQSSCPLGFTKPNFTHQVFNTGLKG